MGELWERDAWELADAVRSGELRATDVLEVYLERIERIDPTLNAICFIDADAARLRAREVDADVAAGNDPGALGGLPMGVKELAQVSGWPDTHASLVYADNRAAFDCTEVARLRAAGAVLVGLTTAPEFGVVSFTNSKLHGVTRNPWDLQRTPGGSSGGSAAAVASGMLPAATGSDGGGSIRIPSSYTGLFGMKTTFGLLGTGPEPFDGSLNSVHGPIVRSVRDAARYLDVTAGPTGTDRTSLAPLHQSFEDLVVSGAAAAGLRGLRAAWAPTLGYAVMDPDTERATHDAAMTLVREAGLELIEVPVELPRPGRAWGIIGAMNTAAWRLDDCRDRLDDLTDVVRGSMEMMMHLRPSGVFKAIRRRHELLVATAEVFSQVDLLLTPTTATPAFAAEGVLAGDIAGEQVELMRLSAAFTAPFNMTGQPACTIPAGVVDGLPVGVQVVARRHDDARCLGAGAVLESVRPWSRLAPGY